MRRRRPGPGHDHRTPLKRSLFALVVAVTVLPAAGAIASVLGDTWHPSGDQALSVLRIGDVGGSHTPLVGAWSRWGWAHPGPALFWSLAPFHRLFGQTGVLVGMGILNAICMVGVVLLARRRGGTAAAALAAVVILVLTNAAGVANLVDPWNPWAAFLPFLLFVFAAWSVAAGDDPALLVAVVAGTFAVQAHLGYVPVVAGIAGLVVGWRLLDRWRRQERPERRWVLAALAAAGLLWLPPAVQQLVSDDAPNVSAIASYARQPTEEPAGWETAFGVASVQLAPVGPWITADDGDPIGFVRSDLTVAGALVPALLVVGALATRGRPAGDRRVALLALAGCALGVAASARVTGLFTPYLVRWWWALAAFSAFAIGWSLLGRATDRVRERVTWVITAVAVGLAGLAVAALPIDAPLADVSRAVEAVAGPTADALDPDAEYLVQGSDIRYWGAAVAGLFLALEERGFDVYAERVQDAELMYGRWRLGSPEEVDGLVAIVDLATYDRGWEPPPGSRIVARFDPLTPDERARSRFLAAEIGAATGRGAGNERLLLDSAYARQLAVEAGAAAASVEEFQSLAEAGDAFLVFVAPAPTAAPPSTAPVLPQAP